jgi:hypothetical protein
MERGYAIAAVGWQADVPPHGPDDADLMTLDVPVVEGVTGLVVCEIVVDELTDLHSLGSRYPDPIEPATGGEQVARLTVRDEPYGNAEALADDLWSFDRLADGRVAIRYPDGFEPGRIYNLVYTGVEPKVHGLGLATTRDLVSFLKYESHTPEGQANPLAQAIDRTHAFGSSQSGRFLRHLLHQGFNEDERGRQVFDGLFVSVAGAGMGSFNHRFAQPSRHSSAHVDTFYPTEQFPFLDRPQTDPVRTETGGLLDLSQATQTTPKVFYINTSTEYWNRGASLTHTTIDGKTDIEPPANVRIYHFSSTQHGPGELPGTGAVLPGNPANSHLGFRALILALDDWVRDGVEPPASAHGIIDNEPPELGPIYPIRLPVVDADGNEIAGIRLPEVAVPLGTFSGWRFRTESMGATWSLAGLQGFWSPFARTRQEAEAAGDQRQSLEARYRDRHDYVTRCVAAARSLVHRRFLLDCDIGRVAQRAAVMYDWACHESHAAS